MKEEENLFLFTAQTLVRSKAIWAAASWGNNEE
jgi:hypothetical protein